MKDKNCLLEKMEHNSVRKKEEQKSDKGSTFIKTFLVMGLMALAIALVLWFVLGRGTKERITSNCEIHHFIGSVGANIHMSILIDETTVTGRYYYDSQRKGGNNSSLILRGGRTGNRIELTESFDGRTTGWFEGNLVSGEYKGTFKRAKDGALFEFNLVETDGGADFFTESEIRLN